MRGMTISTPLRKRDTGEPTDNGGHFGSQTFSADAITLTAAAETRLGFHPIKSGNGEYRLGNDQTDPSPEEHDSFFRQVIRVGGWPHVNTRQRALSAASYSPRERANALSHVAALALENKKVTVLTENRNGYPFVFEGTAGEYRGELVLWKKGSKTRFRSIQQLNVLAVREGYGKQDVLADEYTRRTGHVPALEETTFDRIPDTTHWDASAELPENISAVFMIDGPNFGEGSAPGALFLATDKQDNEIVNGYLWVPDGYGAESEHGSYFMNDLAKGGRVTNFQPGDLRFSDVLNGRLGDTHKTAFAAISEHIWPA